MLERFTTTVRRLEFSLACRGVLDTPPIIQGPHPDLILVSQLRHIDVTMFLVAAKSFAARVPPTAVHIVDDGTLTARDHHLLRHHLPAVRIHPLAEFASPRCPRGGTWERLLAIATLAADGYVIQLDADTLTMNSIDEVATCVSAARAFVIGTWKGQQPEPMHERVEVASKLVRGGPVHVQVLAEANLHRLPQYATGRYIRGCSAFAGFPRGSFSRAHLEELSDVMASCLGTRWSEWGTEQFASNVIIAGCPDPCVLPFPKYGDCTKYAEGSHAFLHFIGTCRFRSGIYARQARKVVACLLGTASRTLG